MKGSDASWENNNEPPDRYLDFSDDEQERMAKSIRKGIERERREGEEMVIPGTQLPGAIPAKGQRKNKR